MSLPASDLTKKPDNLTTMELGAVLPKTASVQGGHLHIGGVDMVELARRQGTALYVFDETDLRARMQSYKKALANELGGEGEGGAPAPADADAGAQTQAGATGVGAPDSNGDEYFAQSANYTSPTPCGENAPAVNGASSAADADAGAGAASPSPSQNGASANAAVSAGAGAGVIYASKAFLNKAVVRIVDEEGLYLDVSGGGELAVALAAGFPAARVFVHGNNKTPGELREAISAGVGRIVVDSRIELARVSEIAGELGVTQDIYMRITPGVEADTHEYIKTGCEDSKFGFTMREDFAFKCVDDALSAPNVRLVGLHCHIGSQIFALESFVEATRVMVAFLARIRDVYGITLTELDMGGGLGVAYTATDNPTQIADFAHTLAGALKDACVAHTFPVPKLFVEPGRSLVANAGVTLYTVGILKTLPGIRKYVAVDGGMSDNIRTALYHASYEPTIANKADMPRTEIVTLCGKHCESGDAVVVDMPLQTPELGDVVCVFATGAYCSTMASNYNGQPRPAVVFVRDGVARVVTRRETYDDLMARDL